MYISFQVDHYLWTYEDNKLRNFANPWTILALYTWNIPILGQPGEGSPGEPIKNTVNGKVLGTRDDATSLTEVIDEIDTEAMDQLWITKGKYAFHIP